MPLDYSGCALKCDSRGNGKGCGGSPGADGAVLTALLAYL